MEDQEKENGTLPENENCQKMSLEQAEQCISTSLKDAARNVIVIGFYLKKIRDQELFRDAGYENIWDYAAGTYGFSKSAASRYMTRNDKFSKGGNSPELSEKYQEYSKSQLQEMLSLDAEKLETVTPDMTVREIRELRKPRELPYYEIPGQLDISDFPELEADEEESEDEVAAVMEEAGASDTLFTVCADDLIGESENECECVATPQQEADLDALRKSSGNAAEKQHYPMDDYEFREKRCNELARKPIIEETPKPAEYDREILEDMIRNARCTMEEMRGYWIESRPRAYTKYSMMIQAYELLLKRYEAAGTNQEERARR